MEPYNIFLGALGGAAWAVTGFVAQKTKPDNAEGFAPLKFVRAVVIGAVLGAVAGPGANLDVYSGTMAAASVTAVVETIGKAAYGVVLRVFKPVKK